MSRLQAVEMKYLRRVAGVTWMDRVRNEEVRERLGQEADTDMIWRWCKSRGSGPYGADVIPCRRVWKYMYMHGRAIPQ